jgi:hypothetical protein
LRVAVEGGGCSGFQYKYDFVTDSPAPDDKVFGTEKVTIRGAVVHVERDDVGSREQFPQGRVGHARSEEAGGEQRGAGHRFILVTM